MSKSKLPERASLEYLRKLAKDRLKELRQTDSKAKLAAAMLSVAWEHGFANWRAMKTEVERSQTIIFFNACASGDVEQLRSSLAKDPSLARAGDPRAAHPDWTGLHTAARRGHADAVRLLLEAGADPNAREAGDRTYPAHWAAAEGHAECLLALLNAGGDPQGFGDIHELDLIGWAAFYYPAGREPANNRAVTSLLIERGARHHIFSAIAVGDLDLIRSVVEQDRQTLTRRLSRFEQRQSALHFAINKKRYDILDLLIALEADLEAKDIEGHTALTLAIMRGDREAISRLHAAGASGNNGWTVTGNKPAPRENGDLKTGMKQMAGSVAKMVSMIRVPNLARTLDWYAAIGFKETARYEDGGQVNFGMVSLGKAELMLCPGGKQGPQDVSLWFYTSEVEKLYELLKSRQIEAAQAVLAGQAGALEPIEFVEDINSPFYGGREFGIRDLNGYSLYFMQPDK